jgi:hypothetical protein
MKDIKQNIWIGFLSRTCIFLPVSSETLSVTTRSEHIAELPKLRVRHLRPVGSKGVVMTRTARGLDLEVPFVRFVGGVLTFRFLAFLLEPGATPEVVLHRAIITGVARTRTPVPSVPVISVPVTTVIVTRRKPRSVGVFLSPAVCLVTEEVLSNGIGRGCIGDIVSNGLPQVPIFEKTKT